MTMDRLRNIEKLFAGRHFDREAILLCVRWYLRYKLSFRDLVERMSERGLHLAAGFDGIRQSSSSGGIALAAGDLECGTCCIKVRANRSIASISPTLAICTRAFLTLCQN
jgi:hypothetical protein